jgi:hypothetical protein
MTKRYHYTTGHHVPLIARDGFLKPATALIDSGEKPALWFSEQPFWEPTVQATMGLAATIQRYGYVVRFEVAPEVCPVSWAQFKRTSGVSPRTARRMEKAREYGGHPELWWTTYERVPRELWLKVERLDTPGSQWQVMEKVQRLRLGL